MRILQAMTAGSLLCASVYALAQTEPITLQNPKIALAAAKLGASALKGMYTQGTQEALAWPSLADSNAVEQDVQLLVKKYQQEKASANAMVDTGAAVGNFFITATEVVAVSTGVGAVPAAILGAGARWANDSIAAELRRSGTQQAMEILGKQIDGWDKAKREEIRRFVKDGNLKSAAEKFDSSNKTLINMRKSLAGDPEAQNAATDVLLSTLANETDTALKQAGKNAIAIADTQKKFAEQVKFTAALAKQTREALDAHQIQLNALSGEMGEARKAIVSLTDSQAATNKQVALIQDILFEREPAATKLALLRVGAKPDLSSSQRASLITYYESQARLEEVIATTGRVVSAAKDLQAIAANFNFSNPTINKVVSYASVAQSAFSQVAAGNYLGALVSISGVFGGGKPDAVQQQFNQVFTMLRGMDTKLNEIVGLQKKTLEALGDLSQQVADLQVHLDSRLDRSQFELERVSLNVRTLMWTPFQQCNSAWLDRNTGSVPDQANPFDDDLLQFSDTRLAYAFTLAQYDSAYSCARSLAGLFDSVQMQKKFGTALSLRAAISVTGEYLATGSPSSTETVQLRQSKSNFERFLTEVHDPSMNLIIGNWNKDSGPFSLALPMLSMPAPSSSVVLARREQLAQQMKLPGFGACSPGEKGMLRGRMRALLCSTDRYGMAIPADAEAQTAARGADLLREALVKDQLIDLVQWASMVARPYDFAGNGTAAPLPSSLDNWLMLQIVSDPRGRDLIWSALQIMDVAIAQRTALVGDLGALAVYEAAWDPATDMPIGNASKEPAMRTTARALLRNNANPLLQRNVLMFALSDRVSVAGANQHLPYDLAMRLFEEYKGTPETAAKDQDVMLRGSFAMRMLFKNLPQEATFEVVVKTGDDRALFIRFGDLKIEMPTTEMFRTRQLLYPSDLKKLMGLRELLVEKLVDYELFRGLDTGTQIRAAQMLGVGLR